MVGARAAQRVTAGGGRAGQAPLAIPLAQAAAWGRAVAGAKATVLSALTTAGFPVPEGVVLTTAAQAACRDDAPGHGILLPPAVLAEVDAIAQALHGQPLAVRSSAAAEDRADTAAAGRYRTVLDVRGPARLRAAVQSCWAGTDGAVALLVQRQVPADAAGVAFTADPVTGERSQVQISALRGMGAAVTDGTADPDRWEVAGSQVRAVHVHDGALTAGQARQVAAMARRVEEHAGCPQDMEWAYADGRLVVLQARPITALPTPPREQLPAGRTWVRETERYAEPFTALGASLAPAIVAAGLSQAFHDAGALADRVEVRELAGRAYLSVSPSEPSGSPPPWWLLGLLARVHPRLRAACARARRTGDPAVIRAQLDRWRLVRGPDVDAAAARLRAVEPDALDDAALVQHLHAVRDGAEQAMAVHFSMTVPETLPVYRLVRRCERMLGWDTAQAMLLLGGASPASTAPGRRLRQLAEAAGPGEQAAVAASAAGTLLTELPRIAPRFHAGFTDWCEQFASRGITDDPGSPVFAERPALLEALIRDAFAGPVRASAAPAEAVAQARRQLAGRRPRDRAGFEQDLRDARAAHGLRDDVAVRTGSTFGGLLRRAALAAGSRLVARGALARREDAVHLRFDELCDAVAGRLDAAEVEALVARCLAERAWARAHPGPDRIGPEPQIPDLRALPAPARELNRALLWAHGQDAPDTARRRHRARAGGRNPDAAPRGPDAGATDAAEVLVRGIPASPGVRTGTVRRILGSADVDRVRPGDVLVCATADPAWSVLFQVAGALVADHAGPLSHAAIMAREHGLPAVLGAGNATEVLRDGQLVTVDGSTGRISAAPAGMDEGV